MTTAKITDDTLLSDYLDSKGGAAALLSRGLATVGSLKDRTLPEIAAIPGVGDRTIEQIRSLRVMPEKKKDTLSEIIENDLSIQLRSPHNNYALQVLPGDAIESGARGLRRIPPIYISFVSGRGELKKKEWLMRVHKRDIVKVDQAMQDGVPWRIDAGSWLKGLKGFNREFFIMTD